MPPPRSSRQTERRTRLCRALVREEPVGKFTVSVVVSRLSGTDEEREERARVRAPVPISGLEVDAARPPVVLGFELNDEITVGVAGRIEPVVKFGSILDDGR